MTVCIGAVCENGAMGIVASDRMVTSTFPPIQFEHTKSKISKITDYCVVSSAGNALRSISIIPPVVSSLGQAPDIETIARRTRDFYQILRGEAAEEAILKPRTLTKEVFYARGNAILPSDLFNMIDHQFIQYDYGLQLLIVGLDNRAHVYAIYNPGIMTCYDTLGFHAIGIGSLHAIQVFIAHSYTVSCNLDEAISIVYAAKKAAEVAPGVGKETDMLFLSDSKAINIDPSMIGEIANIYDQVTRPKKEEVKEKSAKLRELLDRKQEESTSGKETTSKEENSNVERREDKKERA